MHLASPLLLPMSSVACGAPAGAAAPLSRSLVIMARRRPAAHLAVAHARLPGVLLSMPPRTTESPRTMAASPQLPPPCLMVMPPRPSSAKLRRGLRRREAGRAQGRERWDGRAAAAGDGVCRPSSPRRRVPTAQRTRRSQ